MLKRLAKLIIEKFAPEILYAKKVFSQDGEDLLIYSYYENKKNYKGFYVDIGAHHPFRFSNTAFFYKKGWSGINIEPTPTLISTFNKHRKRDINLNIGISEKKEALTFFEFDEPALNSFDEKLSTQRDKETRYKIISKEEVIVYPLSSILDKYLKNNQNIDFFTIDVEGLDLAVLRSNNWQKYSPNFIFIEGDVDFNSLIDNEIYVFLANKGYILVGRTMRTFLFKKSDK